MSEGFFCADWLRLREPFDARARAVAAAALDIPAWAAGWRRPQPELSVIDLACGSGANLRELAPRLGGEQRWLLVDHDPALLSALLPALTAWARRGGHRFEREGEACCIEGTDADRRAFRVELRCRQADLRDLASLPFGAAQLVTASALLDLVSARWLRLLLERSVAARCALLFALNVDGRSVWQPPEPGDAPVLAAFAAHQRRDKGFGGPALGDQAPAEALRFLGGAGYAVTATQSDWLIDATRPGAPGRAAAALQAALIDGMADAAREQEPLQTAAVEAWRLCRLARLGSTRLCVGHLDLIAAPSA